MVRRSHRRTLVAMGGASEKLWVRGVVWREARAVGERPSTAGFHATRQLSTAITARDSARVATYLPTYLPQHPRLGSRPGTYLPTF